MFSYFKKVSLPLLSILLLSTFLRLYNLGYSDYQGDEIKALYYPDPGQNFFSFLMDQRKGPLQFFVTYLLKFINADYTNRFLIRLPFAIAGIVAVWAFYKLVQKLTNERVAFYASFFFATNGFLIAFSRIVQYQSLAIVFMILSLYMFVLAWKEDKFKISGIYLGFIFWAISLLSHYDGVFIAPLALYVLFKWWKENKSLLKHLIISLAISGAMLLAFYVPFVLTLSQATKDYWMGRVTGSANTKLSSSKYLFVVYQPIYVVHIYTALLALGAFFLSLQFIRFKKLEPFKFSSGFRNTVIAVVAWMALPAIFMEKLISIPGTHIYTYIIPLMVIMGLGVLFIEKVIFKVLPKLPAYIIFMLGIFAIFMFVSAQAYAIFDDHSQEYPWTQEKFLIWNFPEPTPVYNLSLFGFPYYRNWDGIKSFVASHPEVTAYTTNEREAITRYFIPLQKDGTLAGFYVYINNPQSHTDIISSDKAFYWASKYDPVYTFSRDGVAMVRIYQMKTGTLAEVKDQGF